MKRITCCIMAILCALCLCWGVSMINVAPTDSVSSQSNYAAITAPSAGGVEFAADKGFDTAKGFTEIPHSYEAVIKVDDGGSSRTGII